MGMMLRRHHPKKPAEAINYSDLTVDLTVKELKGIAKERNIEGYSTLNKEELIAVLEG